MDIQNSLIIMRTTTSTTTTTATRILDNHIKIRSHDIIPAKVKQQQRAASKPYSNINNFGATILRAGDLNTSREQATKIMSSPSSLHYNHLLKHHYHHNAAPLASLDCSITEPLMGDSRPTTPTETPTLSGYFDCDELSDIVDDSLFEITNTGCVSKTIISNQSMQPLVSTRSSVDEVAVQRSEKQQPKQEQEQPPVEGKDNAGCQLGTPIKRPEGVDQIISQVAILASYKPYDYSSTSTVPVSLNKQLANNGSTNHLNSKKRIKSKGSTKTTSSDKATSGSKRSKSELDIRASYNEQPCKICSIEQRQSQIKRMNRQTKKEKKRFTFSLFNIFTGGSGSSSSQNLSNVNSDDDASDDDHRTLGARRCIHMQQHSKQISDSKRSASHQGNKPMRRAKLSGDYESSSKTMPSKARDSIKITNQRKQRNNSNADLSAPLATEMRISSTMDNLALTKANNELLLDFSRSRPIKSSQSNQQLPAGKQTKSVKFTMPDKILPISNGNVSGIAASSTTSFLKGSMTNSPSSTSSHQFPLPPAPIIKKPQAQLRTAAVTIPKSSSYSQTDSDRRLDEMLAKYEKNNELINEINVKLRLTETIASPASALDLVDDDALANKQANSFGPEVVADSASLATDHSDEYHDARDLSSNDHESSLSLNSVIDSNKPPSVVEVDSTSGYQVGKQRVPRNCDSKQASDASSVSSEAEEAGFSRDWLSKRTGALV